MNSRDVYRIEVSRTTTSGMYILRIRSSSNSRVSSASRAGTDQHGHLITEMGATYGIRTKDVVRLSGVQPISFQQVKAKGIRLVDLLL